MVNTTIADLPDGGSANATDRIPIARAPYGPADNRYITPAYFLAREKLIADREYFVATAAGGGNDTNNGRTAGAPFLTLQAAINAVMDLDFNYATRQVTINVADGTYDAASQTVAGNLINFVPTPDTTPFPNSTKFQAVLIKGNVANPQNVIITNSTTPFNASLQVSGYQAFWRLDGIELRVGSPQFGAGLIVQFGAHCVLGASVRFTIAPAGADLNGTQIYVDPHSDLRCMQISELFFSGNCRKAIQVEGFADLEPGHVTFSGTPAYSVACLNVNAQGMLYFAPVFAATTGTIVGLPYSVDHAGFIDANGAGTAPIGTVPGKITGNATYYDPGGYAIGPIPRKLSTHASGGTVRSEQMGRVLTNEGASAIAPFILIPAVAGYLFSFSVVNGVGIRVTAAAGNTIRVAGNVSAAAGKIEATAIGSSVTLMAMNATEWMATAVVGTWTVT